MTSTKRQVFYSFHYEPDNWRASIVRNIGVVEGNRIVSDNDWEEVKRGGDAAIKRWIDSNMEYRSCLIVLIGAHTAGRKWIDYEISHAWTKGMGVVGIYIHNLKDRFGQKAPMGDNPFRRFTINGVPLSNIVRCYNPDPYNVRNDISDHLGTLVEEAIAIRGRYGK